MGELGLWYRLARVAVIGGSFIPHGGQNPTEAARLGVPVLFGPHMENFRDESEGLLAEGRAQQVSEEALAATLTRLLRTQVPPRGAEISESNALTATLAVLLPRLPEKA
jgi:3-deoxy-D-manno-octulosonic-acid transferase